MGTAGFPADGEPGTPGDPEAVARAICLRQLDHRARTRAELAATLRGRTVPDEVAGSVLDRLAEVGLIDDDALASGYALAVHRERGLARHAVAMKLRQRGVEESAVLAAVGQLSAESEADTARRLAHVRLKSLRGLAPQTQARRLVALLARRGYPPGLAHEVVREVLAGAEIAGAAEFEE